jgi:2-oxoisovalerate dehydrogenase E2 component (dihydrolipoyl transacylase)
VSVFGVKLPDVGEGVAEAELIEWYVEVGDQVTPDTVLADVMTDKATVEISSPVSGVVTFRVGEPGEVLAVGTEFVGIEVDQSAQSEVTTPEADEPPPAASAPVAETFAPPSAAVLSPGTNETGSPRPTASPAVRTRAAAAGLDLASIEGSGPDGRVVHADLDRLLAGSAPRNAGSATASADPQTEVLRGLRKRIAKRLTSSWTEIPHITYVDAVDATDLEALRAELNTHDHSSGSRLTILPFLVRAMVIATREQPRLNAHFDTDSRTLTMFEPVHIGIATQTTDGLMVPVVRDAGTRGLWELASEISRVAGAARDGTAKRGELSGSTITITSLGAMGGLMTTPIINQPEVAIVGVNKLETRPVWLNGAFVPRQMFNLSSSFDHRVVDGWDAATFVQRVKALLEMPALLFIDHDA